MERGMEEIGEKKVIHFAENKISWKTVIKLIAYIAASTTIMIVLLSTQKHINSRSDAHPSQRTSAQTNQDGNNHESGDKTHSNHRR